MVAIDSEIDFDGEKSYVRHVNSPAKQFGSLNNIEYTNSVLEGLLHSDFLLTCHE